MVIFTHCSLYPFSIHTSSWNCSVLILKEAVWEAGEHISSGLHRWSLKAMKLEIMEQSKKKKLHQTAKKNAWCNSKWYCIPASLLLVSFSRIKGKKVALYYHPEAICRQRDSMTDGMWYEAFFKGRPLHAAIAGFLIFCLKAHTIAFFKRFASSLPSMKKTFTISIFKISRRPRLSPLALTILGGQWSIS